MRYRIASSFEFTIIGLHPRFTTAKTKTRPSDVGVIGLGVIGGGMAKNLHMRLSKAITLHVYDVDIAACQRLAEEYTGYGDVEIANSPGELTSRCQTVSSSLPSSKIVRDVYVDGVNNVLTASEDVDRLIIETSTIEIETTQEIGRLIIKQKKGTLGDATVSGGTWGAQAEGDIVGRRVFETLKLVGDSEKLQFCGGLGMDQVAKIAHNNVSLANNLVATEGMALGLKYGIDKEALWKCMTDGTANSWVIGLEQLVLGLVEEAPSSNGYSRAFAARLSLKDLGVAINAAKRVDLKPTAGEAAYKAFEKVHADLRTTNLDHTSLWLHLNGNVDEYFQNRNGHAATKL